MTRPIAFLKMIAVLLGIVFVAVGILAGLAVIVAKANHEPLRLTGTLISAVSLSEDEKRQWIVNRIEKIETVKSVETQEIVDQDYTDIRVSVVTTVPHDDATSQEVKRICREARNLWLSLAPRSITCTISTRPATP